MRRILFVMGLVCICVNRVWAGDGNAPPNILFAIADDWGLHGGAYGTTWVKTPTLDRVAREGLLFKNAFTPIAKCAPSRACILTGRYPWLLEDAANHQCYFPAKFKTWPEVLMEQGWFVGITGKGWGPGEAKDATGMPRQMAGVPFNKHSAKPPVKGMANNDYAMNFKDFLDQAPAEKPWCFWYGAMEPHRDYEFQSGVNVGGKQLNDIDQVPAYWPDTEVVRHDMLDYALEVESMDGQLGRMLAELERRGQLDNTLVIFTSDHGMPFPRVKGYAYYDSNHVPLAVRWPKGISTAGRTIDDFVNFTDVAATLLDVAGIKPDASGMAPLSGASWRPIFESDSAGRVVAERDYALVGKERTDVGRPGDVGYPIRGMVREDFLYLKNYEPARWPAGNPETGYLDTDGSPTKSLIIEAGRKQGLLVGSKYSDDRFWQWNFGMRPSEELYDLKADRYCTSNLAAAPEHVSRTAELRETMTAKLKAQGDPRALGNGQIFDTYPVATPAAKNFYERMQRGEKVRAGWVQETDFESQPVK